MIIRSTPSIDKYIASLFCTTKDKSRVFPLEMEPIGSPAPTKHSLQISENMNLGYVQEVLLLALGWAGHHLKDLRCDDITYFTLQSNDEDLKEVKGLPQCNPFQYTLSDLLKLPGDTITFIYDLSDDLNHIVQITDILDKNEQTH